MSVELIQQLRLNQLRKQYLWNNKAPSFSEICKEHLGLHSSDYWTPYLSIYARDNKFNPSEMFNSLNNGQKLVRVNAFRRTLHVVHSENLAFILKVTGPTLLNSIKKAPGIMDCTDQELEQKFDRICETIRDVPKRTSEIKKMLPEFSETFRFLLLAAMAEGKIVRATASHARSNLTTYTPLKIWMPEVDLTQISINEALTKLICLYIKTFGPVSEEDIVWWLSSAKNPVRESLQELTSEIEEIEIDGLVHYMEKEDLALAQTLPVGEKQEVFFLPYEDHFPKAFKRREWFLDEEDIQKLFPRNAKTYWPDKPLEIITKGIKGMGEIRPSIWVDGRIVGRWEIEPLKKKQYKVVMSLYKNLDSEIEDEIKEKKEELSDFINEKLGPIS